MNSTFSLLPKINLKITALGATLLLVTGAISALFWPNNILSTTLLGLTQLICILSYWQLNTSRASNSMRQFSRYITIAIAISLLALILPIASSTLLTNNVVSFTSLFFFLFLFIAIETNPHLRNEFQDDSNHAYLPSLFGIVLLFSYLVIVPSFNANGGQSALSHRYFQCAASIFLVIRLSLIGLLVKSKPWRLIYSLYILAALGLVFEASILIDYGNVASNSVNNAILLLPLASLVLIIWACHLLSKQTVPQKSVESINDESYVTLCSTLFLVLHLTIALYSPDIFFDGISHHLIVIAWVLLATLYLLLRQKQKRSLLVSQHASVHKYQKSYSRQRKEIESLSEQIINSEEKAIVRASNNAILTCESNGAILSANPAAIQMFQLLEHELLNVNIAKLFDKNDELYFFFGYQSNLNKLEREDQGITRESIAKRSDNSRFPVQVELQWAQRQLAPVIVVTIINLTDRKLAEKKALDQKDQFLANVSHEFRTPLTIINGLLDQYLSKSASDDEIQDLTTAKKNGLRLVRMVEQLLELSRVAENPTLNFGQFKLQTLLNLPIESFTKLAKQNQQEFTCTIDNNLWFKCDPQAFEKIVFNLLSNAFKYTPKGGKITLHASQINNNILLDIIDNGIGIKKEAQGKIFDRFQRDESNKEVASFGVGIGLSLVSELVKAHYWDIRLVSEEGAGSKFTLVMPTIDAPSQEDNAPSSAMAEDINTLLQTQVKDQTLHKKDNNLVALVIEDNPDMQAHVKQVIEQKFHCILADDGESGIELAINYVPDIIVCDLMLTGIDGFEVLQYLKQHEITSHVPIIMLTARSDLDTRLKGLSLHADDYLSKPFNHLELLSRMDNLLSNREALQHAYIAKYKANNRENRKTQSYQKTNKLVDSPVIQQTAEEKFLERLEITVAQHYVDPSLDITSLAKLMATSERQLQRKMKMMVGVSPSTYIKEFRLAKAKELLLSGNQVGRIALDVGFSSQTYFGRCFKEAYHCTPKQFQQNKSIEC